MNSITISRLSLNSKYVYVNCDYYPKIAFVDPDSLSCGGSLVRIASKGGKESIPTATVVEAHANG
jgi:hypothetical protein